MTPLSIHSNYPSLSPLLLLVEGVVLYSLTICQNGARYSVCSLKLK